MELPWGWVSNPHRYGQKTSGAGTWFLRERRVSNPRRYGQKLWTLVLWDGTRAFQTLIGTVKRKLPEGQGGGPLRVSNPHRYGQKRPQRGRWGYPQFQTLIGTVKRTSSAPLASEKDRFQTLIGTVKRDGDPLGGHRGPPFQTLIGTVKSRSGGPLDSRKQVSNPHRYGQKPHVDHVPGPGHHEFQTLIGTVKRADSSSCTLGSHRTLTFVFKNPCGRHGGNPAA